MEALFIHLLNMSFTASFVILAILAARLILARAPKIISYALWSAAFIRLVCPITIPVRFGIRAPIAQDIGMQRTPRIDSGIAVLDDAVSSMLPPASETTSANPMQINLAIGQLFWQLGIVILLLWGIVSLLLLCRRLAGARQIDAGVYESARIDTPFVLGWRIYLPAGLDAVQRGMILAHERVHLRRGDPFVKIAAFLVLTVHWFNPLVWLAFVLMSRDMELSCDEAVLRGMDADARRDYARTLLELSVDKPRAITPAFGESAVKARIRNAVHGKAPAVWATAAAVIFAAAVGILLLTAPASRVTVIDFPETEYLAGTLIAEPFTLELALPDGWEAEGASLTCDGAVMANILTGAYEPYDEAVYGPISEENFYQYVYPELRLNRMYNWNIGEVVRIADGSRTHLAEVWHVIDPDDGSSVAAWPVVTTAGITCYDDTKHVYIAIDFAEGAVTPEEQRAIAESIRIK